VAQHNLRMEKPVLIFGAGELGRAAAEIFVSNGVIVYGFLDDDKNLHGKEFGELTVFASTDDEEYLKMVGDKCEAFVAVDENKYRKGIVKSLMDSRKVMPINATHSRAILPESTSIGHGNFLNANVTLGANASIGSHCILNSGAIVDHEAKLGDFVQIGAGSIVNSKVTIEDHVFVGSGATIVSGVTIGKGARIGAGSVVVADVAAKATVFGNPAASI